MCRFLKVNKPKSKSIRGLSPTYFYLKTGTSSIATVSWIFSRLLKEQWCQINRFSDLDFAPVNTRIHHSGHRYARKDFFQNRGVAYLAHFGFQQHDLQQAP